MSSSWLEIRNLTFVHETATEPLFVDLSLRLPPGWTGVLGPNGSGKTTLLRLAAGRLEPSAGRVAAGGPVLYLPQRTDDPPDELADLLTSEDPVARSLTGRFGLGEDWADRWETLSHGERKRAQIAVGLRHDPAVLALDEPTNHVDLAAREQLERLLRGYRGVGLLVSHDRALLDALCERCLLLTPPTVEMRPGGYTKASELVAADAESARRTFDETQQEVKRLERETARRAREAAGGRKRLSKRGLDRRDHDAKLKIDRARLSGKDASAAARLRAMRSRLGRKEEDLAGLGADRAARLGVDLRGERAPRNRLACLAAGELTLGDGRRVRHPDLPVTPDDRIALVGPNGAGKTTLLRRLLEDLDLPDGRLVVLEQEIPRDAAREDLASVRRLPRGRLGKVMTVVRRLGSDPVRLLETGDPSPGEVRKVRLGLGLEHLPWLVVLDEPTNHLDLPSIECLEAALAECECALLLVSHDRRFLRRLTATTWSFETEGENVTVRARAGPP